MWIVKDESERSLYINSEGGLYFWSDNIVKYFNKWRRKF